MLRHQLWADGPCNVHAIEDVRCQCTVVSPVGQPEQADSYPLAIYFCGLGSSGLDRVGASLSTLSRMAPWPFLLVAPIRRPDTWWVLDDHRAPWGVGAWTAPC